MVNGKLDWGVIIRDWRRLAGIASIIVGIMFLLGQISGKYWIEYVAISFVGMLFLFWGKEADKPVGVICGGVLTGVGGGLLFGYGLEISQTELIRAGILLLGSGIGFGLVAAVRSYQNKDLSWWPIFPASILGSTGLCMISSKAGLLEFILFIPTAIGLSLLCVGLAKNWFGLIIPACILMGSGPGIFLAWGTKLAPNPLAQTGLMLVIIAFGWILITVFSRVITAKFVWWPLIPGGVLAVVGWGLYIGGNPGNAISFIGNTGSIGLIVMGLYLMLLRQGIRK